MTTANAFAAFDDPDLLPLISFDAGGGQRRALIRVEGMHCSACEKRLVEALSRHASDVLVQRDAATVELSWPTSAPLSGVLSAIAGAGFRPVVLEDQATLRREATVRRAALKRIGVAGLLGMQVMMLASAEYFGPVAPEMQSFLRWACLLLATPVAFYAGWSFFEGAGRALRNRSITMDVPVATAIGLAWAASAWHTLTGEGPVYFESVVMFVLLLLVARRFQDAGRTRAAEQLRRLAGARPLTALRVPAGASLPHDNRHAVAGDSRRAPASSGVESVPVRALHAGDLVQVNPGETVPVDGALATAEGRFDESLLSGESAPVGHAVGDTVLAGSINAGPLPVRLRVEQTGAATALSQTALLLHRAQAQRPRLQMLTDRIAAHFLAVLLLLCAVAWLWWLPAGGDRALSVVLALLVATCPCALSMALPTALAAAGNRLSRQGLLLARADALLRLRGVDTVCFDKTGTLTTGALALSAVLPLADRPRNACLAVAAAIEAGSSHPVAQAFAAARPVAGDSPAVEHLPSSGWGLRARVDGRVYQLGAAELLAPEHLPRQSSDAAALSWLALVEEPANPADAPRPLALFGLAAHLRPGAEEGVAALKALGLRLEILSGDAAVPVAALARTLGIAHWQARLRPEDKLARVQTLQQEGHGVLAIGDGINDAPLLTAAQVSAAVTSGSALAQARADILLTRARLDGLPALVHTARRTRRVVAQNLAWALAYNAVMVPLAFSGALLPWMGALGMGASSLIVVLNALRLARPSADGIAATDEDSPTESATDAPRSPAPDQPEPFSRGEEVLHG